MKLKSCKGIEVNIFEKLLIVLSNSPAIDLQEFDLLLHGGGGQDREFYHKLRSRDDVQVLWSGWSGPKWCSFLSFLPSQAGLIKLNQQQCLKPLFEELSSHSVSEIYYVPSRFTSAILHEVSAKRYRANVKNLLKGESSYFILQAETDDTIDREDGAYYFFDHDYGAGLHDELKSLIRNSYSN